MKNFATMKQTGGPNIQGRTAKGAGPVACPHFMYQQQ